MHIIVKCWTPEWYDSVSHAIIEVDIGLIEMLAKRISFANKLRQEDSEFMGLQYDRYDPYFVDISEEDVGMTDKQWCDLSDGAWLVVPPEILENHEWNTSHGKALEPVNVRPCMLMVMAGDDDLGHVYWYGYDKHGGSGCRAETYSISKRDLHHIADKLGYGLCKKCGCTLGQGHDLCTD